MPWAIVAVLLVLLFTKNTETKTITIPEKTGKFEQSDPKPITKIDTVRIKGELQYIEVENPINQELLNDYISLKDSVAKIDFVKDKLEERTYRETFQDSTQTITVKSEVQGRLLNQRIDYKIFPQRVEVKAKTPKYTLFLGTYTTIPTKDINAPTIGANISLKSPKTIYSLGYDTQQNLMAGIAFKLF